MLKVSLDLDFTTDGVTNHRELKVGEPLPIVVKVEHDGSDGTSETSFDSLVVQIVFNNRDADILSVSPEDCPIAGNIASLGSSVCCASCGAPVSAGAAFDPGGPFSAGTQLMLIDPPGQPPEPYRSMTGLAGVRDLDSPITLNSASATVDLAGGRAATGMPTLSTGDTDVTALGYALNGSEPIPVKFVKSTVIVTP